MAGRSSRAARKTPGSRPRVTRTDDQESESKRLFEEALAPWPVRWRERKDYGLDGNVEITRLVPGTPDSEVTGREFAVQLKATDALHPPTAISVETGHVRYWLEHTLPVLLVHAHLPTKTLRGRWVDDGLYDELRSRNPSFWSQGTVSIPLGVAFPVDASAKQDIELAVAQRAKRGLLAPSRFFELREQVEDLANRLDASGRDAQLESVRALVSQTRKALRLSAYTVAITGPQRVGKSTLVNALLGVDVSPVADYPTTAVPLVFTSGERSEAVIAFGDSTTSAAAATSEALRPFAAQRSQALDGKTVQVVRVSLPNEWLARGIALVDTPGRHDASKVVREVTDAALKDADAVLYVLDAGLGSKFKIGQHEVEDLQMLQGCKERLLVVLNQADLLNEEQRASLLRYVMGEMETYGLGKGLPVPPAFVSGQEGWEARCSGQPSPPEFQALEENLWGHLLRTRMSGLHRLQTGVGLMRQATDQTLALTAERTASGTEAADLANARRTCQQGIEEARRRETEARREARKSTDELLKSTHQAYTSSWNGFLNSTPLEGALPSTEVATGRLVKDALDWRGRVWGLLFGQLQVFAQELNDVVQESLDDARSQLGLPASASTSFEPSPPKPFPALDLSMPEAHLGFWGGAVGFLVNPLFGLFTTAVAWLVGLKVGEVRRRDRVLRELSKSYRKKLLEAQRDLQRQVAERFGACAAELVQQVEGRLGTFMRDAERRMERLGTPLSAEEASRLERVRSDVVRIRKELDLTDQELKALLVQR